jgi:hypothetical protein
VAFTVLWQTSTIAAIGVLVGIPLGIATGRTVWRLFAGNLGVRADPTVDLWVVLVVGGGAIAFSNLLAVGPAIVASRSRPASLLNEE